MIDVPKTIITCFFTIGVLGVVCMFVWKQTPVEVSYNEYQAQVVNNTQIFEDACEEFTERTTCYEGFLAVLYENTSCTLRIAIDINKETVLQKLGQYPINSTLAIFTNQPLGVSNACFSSKPPNSHQKLIWFLVGILLCSIGFGGLLVSMSDSTMRNRDAIQRMNQIMRSNA